MTILEKQTTMPTKLIEYPKGFITLNQEACLNRYGSCLQGEESLSIHMNQECWNL